MLSSGAGLVGREWADERAPGAVLAAANHPLAAGPAGMERARAGLLPKGIAPSDHSPALS